MKRSTFKLYRDFRRCFDSMSDSTAGQVIKAVFAIEDGEQPPEMSETALMAFKFIEPQIQELIEKASAVAERNRENGNKGGRPKAEKPKKTQKNPVGFDAEKEETIDRVIEYLNMKANKRFSKKSEQTREHIRARVNDGYSLDDFKHVIDVKVAEWKGDEKMEQYLRPMTLFRPNNFENYLNQRFVPKQKQKTTFVNFEQGLNLDDLEAKLDRQFAGV